MFLDIANNTKSVVLEFPTTIEELKEVVNNFSNISLWKFKKDKFEIFFDDYKGGIGTYSGNKKECVNYMMDIIKSL